MGLESISSESLALSRKSFNHPERYPEVVKALHERKIALQGCFVFGHDNDSDSVFEDTAKFAVEMKIDLPRFAILTPFPATPLYRRLDAEGRILTRNWELYDGQHVVYQPRSMSVNALQQGTEEAWMYAYKWSSILKRMQGTAAPFAVAALTNITYRRYGYNLQRFYHCDAMVHPGDLVPGWCSSGSQFSVPGRGVKRAN